MTEEAFRGRGEKLSLEWQESKHVGYKNSLLRGEANVRHVRVFHMSSTWMPPVMGSPAAAVMSAADEHRSRIEPIANPVSEFVCVQSRRQNAGTIEWRNLVDFLVSQGLRQAPGDDIAVIVDVETVVSKWSA